MSPKLKACLLVTPVVALAGALSALPWRGREGEDFASSPRSALVSPAAPTATVAFCRRAAELLYDITWAAACDALGEDWEGQPGRTMASGRTHWSNCSAVT